MFETLMNMIRRSQAMFDFELANCLDPYRLRKLLKDQAEDLGHRYDEANQMVKELEKE